MNRSLVSLLLAPVLLLSACGLASDSTTTSMATPPDTPATTSAVTTSPVTTSAVTTGPAANDLAGFDRAEINVEGEPLVVAVAATGAQASQGLMGVTDLVDVDGMLFVFITETFPDEVQHSFWMKDTLIPLDIWFFDRDGGFVDMLTMTPCEAEPCELYTPSGPYGFALETEVGRIVSTEPVLEFAGISG